MSEVEFKVVESNGINIRLAMMGEGPLVIFCHGWPESWYSYRHQLPVVAKAGFKAVAYDVRGYGESDKPHEIEAYTMRNMTDDVVGIIDALGYETAITIGHDWGGPIALNTAALNEDRITATGTLSVPFMGRGPMPTLDLWKEIYQDRFFYQLYFQKEGIAEKEFESDLSKALFMTYTNSDGRGMKFNLEKGKSGLVPEKTKDSTFLEGMEVFEDFPNLNIGSMEARASWVPFFMERLDEEWNWRGAAEAPKVTSLPSNYFHNGRIYVCCEPDEALLPTVMEFVGEDWFMYASDYPHPDSEFPESLEYLRNREDMDDIKKNKIIRENAIRFYGLDQSA